MSGKAPIIRASEVGRYVYCNRAWWYTRQGVEPANPDEILAGIRYHRLHGMRVRAIRVMTVLAITLLIVGAALAMIGLLLGGST